MITVRPANADDADLLLRWANEPTTRAAGFHPDPIDPDTHRAWLARRLADPRGRLFIGVDDGEPIGVVRLDVDQDGRTEVGISVAEAARGGGAGRRLLTAGLEAATATTAGPRLRIRTFVARIRPDNAASLALFASGGFRDVGPGEVNGRPCRLFERAAPAPDAR